MAKRKQFSEEFKIHAVQQWQESGKSAAEVAKDLGISTSSLYTWRDQYPGESAVAPGPEAVKEPVTAAEGPAEEEAEVAAAESDGEEAVGEKEAAVERMAPLKDEPISEAVVVPAVSTAAVSEVEADSAKKGGTKAIIKRILGGVGVVLGGIGLLLSIALIIVVWVVNKPVTDGAVELVSKVEIGLTVANNGLEQADESLANVRQQIRDLTEAVPLNDLQSTITDMIALVDGIQTTVDTASSVVGLADTFPVSILRRGEPEPVETPKLDEVSNTLEQISTGLGTVEAVLLERQETGLGPVGTQVDSQIDDLQTRIQGVNTGVEEGISTTVQLQVDLPGIIDTITFVLTLLFLWLGIAQYALLVNGWHWVRQI